MQLIDFVLHIDKYLAGLIDFFGVWTYLILFLIVFAETGLVITPFLPGDSLLFAIGVFAGAGYLQVWISYFVLLVAAIIGDSVNYWIGNRFRMGAFKNKQARILKPKYLTKTHEFYEKYGGRTIVIARFVPIVRTFAPFVAGVGKMNYRTFFFYNVTGALLWVTSLLFAGYFFGGIQFVKDNFEYVIMGIIVLSLLPILIEYLRHKKLPKEQRKKKVSYKDIEKAVGGNSDSS